MLSPKLSWAYIALVEYIMTVPNMSRIRVTVNMDLRIDCIVRIKVTVTVTMPVSSIGKGYVAVTITDTGFFTVTD